MKTNLQKNWWVLSVNGILAVLFGGLALFATETMLLSISMYFGLLVLVGGVLLLLGAFDQRKKKKNYSLMFTEGLISIVLGILIMIYPNQTLKLFLIFIGVWALLLGIFKIYIAIAMGKIMEYRYVMIIGGILLIGISFMLLLNPAYVAGLVLQIVGAIFVVLGIMLIYFSFVIKNAKTI
ncbi:MAG: DUF308 domain-containing protein [Bacteroidetes bacterium]|nr:DUF308 domain-containing protein [Bacteroidota bacterium]